MKTPRIEKTAKTGLWDLLPSPLPTPQARDLAWARRILARATFPGAEGKPLKLIRPWTSGHRGPRPVDAWDALLLPLLATQRFWQIGEEGDPAVQGCEYYVFLKPGSARDARRIAALLELSQGWFEG
jgi:hypothetical protein